MASRQVKVSRRMLIAWLGLLAVIILLTPESVTSRLQLAFAGVFRLPLKVGRTLSLSAQTERSSEDDVARMKSRYENHIRNLDMQLDEARERYDRLSGLKGRYPWDGVGFVLADISTSSLDGAKNELTVGRGAGDGIRAGCFVLGDNSVIGTVTEVGRRTSRVRLATDAESRMEVTIEKLKLNRMLEGVGNGIAKVRMVKTDHNVRKGDKVFSLRKSGFLGSSMVVGEVVEVKRDAVNPVVWDITVEPVCRIEELTDVAVVVMDADK